MGDTNNRNREYETLALGAAIQRIDQSLDNLSFNAGADEWSSHIFNRMTVEKRLRLEAARNDVYFARIDFVFFSERKAQSFYISRYNSFKTAYGMIIDWRSPIASLFYEGASGLASYRSVNATIQGVVTLRRRIIIEGSILRNIVDDYSAIVTSEDIENLKDALEKEADHLLAHKQRETDQLEAFKQLAQVLSKPSTGSMHDIVTTIQKEQYYIIHQPLTPGLIIEGPAGSGKTAIALHRVSFLLYEEKHVETLAQQRSRGIYRESFIDAKEILVLGPNKLFLSFIKDVLPSLIMEDVIQTTFERYWLWLYLPKPTSNDTQGNKLRNSIVYEITDYEEHNDLANYLPTPEIRRIALKSHENMASILENYCDYYRGEITTPSKSLNISYVFKEYYGSFHYVIPVDDIARIIKASLSRKTSFNKQRYEVLKQLWKVMSERYAVERNYNKRPSYGDREYPRFEKTMISVIDTFLLQECNWPKITSIREIPLKDWYSCIEENSEWPRFSSIGLLKRLLTDHQVLFKCIGDLLNKEDIAHILDPKATLLRGKREDMALISYIEYLFIEPLQPRLQHIVVDEAQDLSSVQYFVLGLLSKIGSFTLLGDPAQSIFPERGINSWEEAQSATNRAQMLKLGAIRWKPFQKVALTQTYRSTSEINAFTYYLRSNHERNDPNTQSLDIRHGSKPILQGYNANDLILAQMVAIVRERTKQNHIPSIAILTKTSKTCDVIFKYMHKTLKQNEMVSFPVNNLGIISSGSEVSQKQSIPNGLVCATIWQSKGIEFDTVIIPEVDFQNFTISTLDRRLLYVASSRAMHELFVFWNGEASPLLTQYMKTVKDNQN